MTIISANLQAVQSRIAAAAKQADRPAESIKLIAVSKTVPLEKVREAARCGQRAFGENYVQEGLLKAQALPELEWHFIGPLQSNKTRVIAEHFSWVHGIDRLKIAERLSAARGAQRTPLQVCIQINISEEATKHGVGPAEAAHLARAVARLPHLCLRGLMAIPEVAENPALTQKRFAALRRLLEELNHDGLQLDTLSMGMTQDLEVAIQEGATIVRVGTAIFGERGLH